MRRGTSTAPLWQEVLGLFLGLEPCTELIQRETSRCNTSSTVIPTARVPKGLWFGTRMVTCMALQSKVAPKIKAPFLRSTGTEILLSCTTSGAEGMEADRRVAC